MADIGKIKEVKEVNGQHVAVIDMGYGPAVTATIMQVGGSDFSPLAGDMALFHRAGKELVVSAIWSKDTESSNGEWLAFSRNSLGSVVATIYAKADGSIEFHPTTTVSVGNGGDFVAMSSAVTAMWNALAAVCNSFTGGTPDGGAALAAALGTAIQTALASVTIPSSNLKAD